MRRITGSLDIGELTLTLYVGYLDAKSGLTGSLLCEGCDIRDRGKVTRTSFTKVIKFLHSHFDILAQCSEILIEQQIKGKIIRAYKNIVLEQHIQGYIDTINEIYRLEIAIVPMHPRLKYYHNDGPYGEKPAIRKSWSPLKAIELLISYGNKDEAAEWTEYIINLSKGDEVGDAITQLYAFYKAQGLVKSISGIQWHTLLSIKI